MMNVHSLPVASVETTSQLQQALNHTRIIPRAFFSFVCAELHSQPSVLLQGFASGSLDDDAFAPRFFVDQGLEVMVSQSYSKNLGKSVDS